MMKTHDALLRSADELPERVALIGVAEPTLTNELGGGLAMTEHRGTYDDLIAGCGPGWRVAFGYDDPALTPGEVEGVVVFMPKSRRELAMRLALARSLAPGGECWLVGGKKEGVGGGSRLLKDLFPNARKIDSARHCQVWQADIPAGAEPFRLSDWLEWHDIGLTWSLAHLPGVFSDGRLDEGTALLLGTLDSEPPVAGSVLDFACGAGVIMTALGHPSDREVLHGVDAQAQAVYCARQTLSRAGVDGEVWASDGLNEVGRRYQLIVSNPPFHLGVETTTAATEAFLTSCRAHLAPGGELRLVANRFLPYEALIGRYVGRCEKLASNDRFVVYRAFG
ncbi:16S rRNA m(2)G 1207 methyltransferase [Tamilnaduibacter salinus]|uniref:Ribosomal RNA small subunit methyltransferase C n=1 Tax=Tamilnaduibacter salinus TaxID=1484056 RepID=A0A2U1CVM1_9GAMM|nr:methyltransferase [Tamilnaduibacter salinus]PVY75464.1 16S rRNA m(2)G 1207 methyltransferase [Tamilnaduibacter salinus]